MSYRSSQYDHKGSRGVVNVPSSLQPKSASVAKRIMEASGGLQGMLDSPQAVMSEMGSDSDEELSVSNYSVHTTFGTKSEANLPSRKTVARSKHHDDLDAIMRRTTSNPTSPRGEQLDATVADIYDLSAYLDEDGLLSLNQLLEDGVRTGDLSVPAAQLDEWTMLRADTPLSRLRLKCEEVEEQKQMQSPDLWRLVKLHQDIVALAKVQAVMSSASERRPLLLPVAHYHLAKHYALVGCIAQAAEHCERALDQLPVNVSHDQSVIQVLKRNVNVLLAEAFLKSDPPKPQVALQHIRLAAGTSELQSVQPLGLVILACKALKQMAEAKMHEARGTQFASQNLSLQLDKVAIQIKESLLKNRKFELASLKQRITDLEKEKDSEDQYEAKMVDMALQYVTSAIELMYNGTTVREDEIKQSLGGDSEKMRQHPVVKKLRRQLCELGELEAACWAMQSNVAEERRALQEILSSQEQYQCIPGSMLARVLKGLGPLLVHERKYEEALSKYNELMDLQSLRYSEDYRRQTLARAECYKLCGDVYVAAKQFNRAREHFELALGEYTIQLGQHHELAEDLRHRLHELQYYEAPATMEL